MVLLLLASSPEARQLYFGAWERVAEYKAASAIERVKEAQTRALARLLPVMPIPVAPGKLQQLRRELGP
jgi:hypothetical protein